MMVHFNTPAEIGKLRGASGNLSKVVPPSNRIAVSTNGGKIDYVKMDSLCRSRKLSPCQTVPVRTSEVEMTEGFQSEQSIDIQRPLLIAGGVLMLGAVAMLISGTGTGQCK
jgi:hypothetical protein